MWRRVRLQSSSSFVVSQPASSIGRFCVNSAKKKFAWNKSPNDGFYRRSTDITISMAWFLFHGSIQLPASQSAFNILSLSLSLSSNDLFQRQKITCTYFLERIMISHSILSCFFFCLSHFIFLFVAAISRQYDSSIATKIAISRREFYAILFQ